MAKTKVASLYAELGVDNKKFVKGLKDAKEDMTGIEKAFKALSAGMILGGAGMAFKKTFDFAKEGASVKQLNQSFEGLLDVIGVAPDLLDKLRRASRGTIDDMNLMSSTSTLLAGTQGALAKDLANSTPQLLEIAKAASKLNPALGDTTFLYQSLALGIKRASPMILDNLGITLKVEEAYEKYAQSIGKTAQALTKDEQAQALLNATIAKGKVLIEQAGGSVDSASDKYVALEIAIKNITDAAKSWVYDALTPAINTTSDLIDMSKELGNTIRVRLMKAWNDGTISATEYQEVNTKINKGTWDVAEATAWLNKQYRELESANKGVTKEEAIRRAGLDKLTIATGEYSYAVTSGIEAYQKSRMPILDYKSALDEVRKQYDDVTMAIDGRLGPAQEDYNKKQSDLKQRLGEAQAEMDKLLKQGYNPLGEKMQNIKEKIDEIKGSIEEEAAAHEEATKRILLDLLIQRASMDELTSAEMTMIGDLALKWGLVDQATWNTAKSMDNALSAFAGGTGAAQTMATFDRILAMDGKRVVTYIDIVTSNLTQEQRRNEARGTGPGGQHGLNMVVPPGFPNDTFPVRASSGEQVIIIPGMNVNMNAAPGMNADALFQGFVNRLQREMRHSASTGRHFAGA